MARTVTALRPTRPTVRQAAAATYPLTSGAKAKLVSAAQKSNTDLWKWYTTPEVWSVANRVAAGVRRVSFYPAVNLGDGIPGDRCPPLVNPDGTTAEGVDARLAVDAAAVWDQVRSPLGSQSDLFGMLALCLMVAGDGIQFGYPAADDLSFDPAAEQAWVAFARTALTERSGLYEVDVGAESKVKVPPQTDTEPGGRVVRVWDPDPRAPAQATVWVQAARDKVAVLADIYEAVAACALSRMNAGIVLAPDNQDRPPTPGAEVNEEGARQTLGEPLYHRLVDLFADHVEQSQVVDGFARAVPAAIGMDKDLIEKVRWLELAHNLDPELGKRIDDLRYEIALAAPTPPEILLGLGQTNHWNGEQIDQAEYNRTTVPVCERICHANTLHVLRLTLVAMNHDPRAVEGVRVGYSADELLMKPDRTEAAIALAQLPVPAITPEELRDAVGLAEFAGPDEDTQKLMLAERLLMERGAEFEHLLEYLGLPPVPAAVAESAPAPIDASSTVAEVPALPARTAAAPAVSDLGERLVKVATRYEDALAVLFGAVVDAMVARAGSRVASMAKRGDWSELRTVVRDAPAHLRGAIAGVNERVAAAGVDDDDLLGGALAAFAGRFAALTTDAQRRAIRTAGGDWDDSDADAELAAAAAWALAGRLLMGEARRRFDGRLPDDGVGEGAALDLFAVPAGLVRRVSAVAGGAVDAGEGSGGSQMSTVALMTVATGPLAVRALERAGSAVTAWMWDYRPEEERATYEDHLDLHEAIELGAEPGEFDGYFPGDHHGCRCVLRPITASGALGEGVDFE